jgi:DNA-directed RNA polymerase specialized sigma24 family protein
MAYDSEDNYTALTFTRFWSALREQRLRFANLSTVLSYLHATLNSTIVDTLRMYMRVKCLSLLDPAIAESAEIAIEETYHDDWTWRTIQNLLTNEDERRLMYLLYYCGFKPREVVARFPAYFRDVKEIYRLNHNIIERLRRQRDRLGWLLGNQEWEERARRDTALTIG